VQLKTEFEGTINFLLKNLSLFIKSTGGVESNLSFSELQINSSFPCDKFLIFSKKNSDFF